MSDTEVHTEVGSNIMDANLDADEINAADIKIRSVFITLNNYTDAECKALESIVKGKEKTRYLVYQLEVGENGTPHIQGFMLFRNNILLSTLRNALPRACFFKPRNNDACDKYCQKERTRVAGPFIFGTKPQQGKRNDLELAARAFIESPADIFAVNNPVIFMRYHKGLQALKNVTRKHRDIKVPPIVHWNWGVAGSGKTRFAYEAHESVYIKDGSMWWDGYDHETAIVIDDFDGKWPYRDFLRLLDRYPYQGQVKGGYVKITSPYIYITCEYPPWEFWQNNELAQVNRRITKITNFSVEDSDL